MGTQTTGGGSTTSFVTSPQAVDDSYWFSEDSLLGSTLYNATTKSVTLDVMSNDLGGAAKSLFSIDDGNGNTLAPDFQLLYQDVTGTGCSPWEKTPDGNWIRINNGKIEFKLGNPLYPDDPAKALSLDSLGTDRSVNDEFVYAIRLGNGTLSQATVHIHISGENDAVELAAVTGATVTDTAANDTFANITGALASSDKDFGDTPTYGLADSEATGAADFDVKKVTAYGTLYLNTTTGAYKFVPDNAAIQALDSHDANVVLNFGVSVTDGDSTDTDTLTITLDGANDTPELAAVTGATINDGAGNDSFADITGTLIGTDRDADETLAYGLDGSVASEDPAFDYKKTTAYGTLYLDKETGAYKFVADNSAINGLDSDDAAVVLSFALSVSDGDASASRTLTITLNGANDTPVLTGTAATLPDGTEDNAYTVTKAQLLQGWTDADDGEVLSITGLTASNGTIVANANGSYTITPTANFNGSVTLNYNVSDGTVAVAASLSYTLVSVNDAPAGTNGSVTTLEDTAKALGAADFGFTDPSDNPANSLLAVKITTLPATGTLTLDGVAVDAGDFVSVADINDGKLVYTPAANATASASFTFQVQDNGGTDNGGVDLDQSANTLTINITPVNDAPAGTDSSVSVTEDTPKALSTADFGFTDPNDAPANTLLAVKITTLPASGTLKLDGAVVSAGQTVSASDIADGKLVYTPAADATGAVTFTFQVQDNGGTANGGIDLDASANTLTLNIAAVNDKPVNTIADYSATEDTPKQLTGLAVSDVDAGTNAIKVTLTVASGTLTATGGGGVSVAGSGTGTLELTGTVAAINAFLAAATAPTFNPALNAFGDVTLTMTTTDNGFTGSGGAQTDTDSVKISIAAVNDAAVITGDDARTIVEDATPNTVSGNLNSTDVDGVDDSWQAQTLASANGYGSLTIGVDGQWTYTLDNTNAAVNGLDNGSPALTDLFTVKTADGTERQITITINGHTDAPAETRVNDAANDKDFDDPSQIAIFNGATVRTGDFNGGGGADIILGNGNVQTLQGQGGGDTIHGAGGGDTISGGGGDDTLYGGAGNDGISGGGGDDVIYGGSGNDIITGNDNTETIYGGSGDDDISGNAGQDQMWGGTGQDDFIFGSGDTTLAAATRDKINDFSHAEGDHINLIAFTPSAFVGVVASAAAVGINQVGYIVNADGSLTVFADTNGIAGADIAIDVVGVGSLQASDFIL